MSRIAVTLLMLTLVSVLSLWLELLPAMPIRLAAALFASAFVVALVLGRRIKFDPVLR